MTRAAEWQLVNLAEAPRPGLVEHVKDFWRDNTELSTAEIDRRSEQLLIVAVTGRDEPIGVSTVYLQTPERLGVPLWVYRTLVAPSYRQQTLARELLIASFDWLERQFTAGRDTQSRGVYMEIENPVINRHRNEAVWQRSKMAFVGTTGRGHVCRVRYFEGARID